ncbi:heterogeneous nuclear ribonucleoprotein H3-like isoform X2 [Acanthaster planci]|uniref:Heterogeneous nuclear ribonucleoprotein H3-like isoform X2 n=1 Tax=Acanthaster planci TaxID=133434 RepID=A0A8B7Y9H0_ACAPL|nr:heterogeneous nuclear ribonucleoprotein H3-like isoform X2 [Acanthaster planci]
MRVRSGPLPGSSMHAVRRLLTVASPVLKGIFTVRASPFVMSVAPGTEESDGFVVRARGLPWSCTHHEVMKFFDGCNILGGKDGIHFTFNKNGRPSGECFVEFETEEDFEQAMTKHKKEIGSRYIEVFRSKVEEREWVMKRSGAASFQDNDACIRMRGIPYECSKEEVMQFFNGLEIVANGITLPTDQEGKCTGDAFVQFASKELAEKALQKHMHKLGHRYVEIFHSSMDEIRRVVNANKFARAFQRPGPYDRYGGGAMFGGRGRGPSSSGFERRYRFDGFGGGYEDNFYGVDNYGFGGGSGGSSFGIGGMMNRRGRGMRGMGMRGGFGRGGGGGGGGGGGFGYGGSGGGLGGPGGDSMGPVFQSQTGHSIHMRGLPFSATEEHIMEWFGKSAVPCRVVIKYNSKGQPSGEADVDFIRHRDAVAAMGKDKEHMMHRYIELFLNSEEDGEDGDGGYGDMPRMQSGMGGSGGGSYGGGSSQVGSQGGGFGNQGNGFGNQSSGMRSGSGYTSFESQGGTGFQGENSSAFLKLSIPR